MNDSFTKLKAFDQKLEWPVRLIFTIAVLFTLLRENTCEEHNYPLNAFCIMLLALWCYFFKIRIVAVILLLLQILIAYLHPAV